MADEKTTLPASGGSDGSLMGTLASWGGSAWAAASAAATSVSSFLGFEDLDVVDPTAGSASRGGSGGEGAGAGNVDEATRMAAFANFRDFIGMDITSLVTLPVWIMEPYTLLQKVAEIMEYTGALEKAVETEDEFERMAWVAGFCLGPFGSNERTWKPFNPILGETFELDFDVPASTSDADPTADASGEEKVQRGRFLAEQVSHHPPIGAAHAEAPRWAYDIVSAPTTKFLGNSIDIFPVGRSRIHLKEPLEETYSLVPPNSKAHNLIVGRTWVDCYGDFSLLNTRTGSRCLLRFTPCGWFGAGRYEVRGHVVDAGGAKKLLMEGAWNSHLDYFRCDAEGNKVDGSETVRVWQCSPKPEPLCKYGFTKFAKHLCSGAGVRRPLASDSRRRPDRAALERGDHAAAGTAKHALEEVQRAEKKERARRGEEWEPRWFVRLDGGGQGKDAAAAAKAAPLYPGEVSRAACPMWSFKGRFPGDKEEGEDDDDDCVGKGFSPWQFPELHGNGSALKN